MTRAETKNMGRVHEVLKEIRERIEAAQSGADMAVEREGSDRAVIASDAFEQALRIIDEVEAEFGALPLAQSTTLSE